MSIYLLLPNVEYKEMNEEDYNIPLQVRTPNDNCIII